MKRESERAFIIAMDPTDKCMKRYTLSSRFARQWREKGYYVSPPMILEFLARTNRIEFAIRSGWIEESSFFESE